VKAEIVQLEEAGEGELKLTELEAMNTQAAIPTLMDCHSDAREPEVTSVLCCEANEPVIPIDHSNTEESEPPMVLSELDIPEQVGNDIADHSDVTITNLEHVSLTTREHETVGAAQIAQGCNTFEIQTLRYGSALLPLLKNKRGSLDHDTDSEKVRESRIALGDMRVNVRHSLA